MNYTRGVKRRANQAYKTLMQNSSRQRRKGNVERAEIARKKAQQLPSQMTNDPDYRRLKYVRYADDFLLGFIGPKSEAEEIKQALQKFLREELNAHYPRQKRSSTISWLPSNHQPKR
jgi:hypothetical protein